LVVNHKTIARCVQDEDKIVFGLVP